MAAKSSTKSSAKDASASNNASAKKKSKKKRDRLEGREFAFPAERKEPLDNASHVRNAVARFNQVKDVTDDERDRAWKRIKKAAKKYRVNVSAGNWRALRRGGKADGGKADGKAGSKAGGKKKKAERKK